MDPRRKIYFNVKMIMTSRFVEFLTNGGVGEQVVRVDDKLPKQRRRLVVRSDLACLN